MKSSNIISPLRIRANYHLFNQNSMQTSFDNIFKIPYRKCLTNRKFEKRSSISQISQTPTRSSDIISKTFRSKRKHTYVVTYIFQTRVQISLGAVAQCSMCSFHFSSGPFAKLISSRRVQTCSL